jgi:hypothetical protein
MSYIKLNMLSFELPAYFKRRRRVAPWLAGLRIVSDSAETPTYSIDYR